MRPSVSTAGVGANDESEYANLSADGRLVAFYSWASNLVPNDNNAQADCFVHDRLTGTTARVSVDSAGGQASGESWFPALSADGRFVAFHSTAKDLVTAASGASWAVYVHLRDGANPDGFATSNGIWFQVCP